MEHLGRLYVERFRCASLLAAAPQSFNSLDLGIAGFVSDLHSAVAPGMAVRLRNWYGM